MSNRTAITITAPAGILLLLAFTTALVRGQSAQTAPQSSQTNAPTEQPSEATTPSFEVASIEPDHSDHTMSNLGGPDAGRFTATNVTAKTLIDFAYNMQDFQVSGGPPWITSETFDLDAKVEDALAEQWRGLPRAQQIDRMRPLVRSLLADRFRLTVTRSTKELPAYALVVSKRSENLKEAAASDVTATASTADARTSGPLEPPAGQIMETVGVNGKAKLIGRSARVSGLAAMLSQRLRRPVLDETDLKGTYDFSLDWSADVRSEGGQMFTGGNDTAPDISGTSIFAALQEQLGLKLKSIKAPAGTLSIDHIEPPSPN